MITMEAQRLLDEAWNLRDVNRKRATQLLDQVNHQFVIQDNNNSDTAIVSAQLQVVLGFFLFRDARFESAIQCLRHAIAILDPSDACRWMARAHGTLGIALVFAGMNTGAVEAILQQVALAQQLNDTAQLGTAYQSLSWIYTERSAYQEAADYLLKALAIHRELGLHFQVAMSLANLASCYIHLDQAGLAQAALDESMQLCIEHEFDLVSNIAVQHNGLLEEQKSISTQSFAYLDRGLGVSEQMDDDYSVVRALIHSGRIYTDAGGRDKALTCYDKALTLAQQLNARELIYTIHEQLAQAYESFGDYQLALEQYRLFHRSRESVFLEQSELRVQTLQVRHETESAQREATWLQSQNALLEKRVSERTQELEETTRKLQKAHHASEALSRLQSQIISTVSHEFRTPLTTIHSSAELLIKHYDRISAAKRDIIGQRIHTAIHYLTDLLQDVVLVDATQTNDIQPTLKTMPFNHLWDDLAHQLMIDLGQPANVSFVYDANTEHEVKTDVSLLKQIMSNLLTNAIKYSSQSPILVNAAIVDDLFVVTIQDEGIGIPAAEQARIWDILYRASNVETRRGLGLGLYIVRQLSRALDGEVSVYSAGAEQGSRFTLRFPLL